MSQPRHPRSNPRDGAAVSGPLEGVETVPMPGEVLRDEQLNLDGGAGGVEHQPGVAQVGAPAGLDVLTIEAGEEEGDGPALGVGRYVAGGVYVGARQGVAENSTAGTVEIEVLPGLAIESEVSEGAEGATGALGLRWKWDY